MEGGGGHAPPRSARLRGPPPPFSRATSTSARFARRQFRWNAPLSLRYGALPRASPRLRGATEARCVGARCSPPANTARQRAASQTRRPAPLHRQAKSSRSASGAQARAFTRSGERALAARGRASPPASASPVLASETLASSLTSAAAWSCAGPQCQPHLWPGVRSAWPKGSPCHP